MTRTRRHLTPARTAAVAVVAASAAGVSLLYGGAGSAQATGAPAPGTLRQYVAIGDSYAAGNGLPEQKAGGCQRSERSYPSQLARKYGAGDGVFKDVTCSGATTKSLWNPQGSWAPQVKALTKDTDLVTITLGGNDLGFRDTLTACAAGFLKARVSCKNGVAATMPDKLNHLASRTRDMITDISRRSPKARIVVVGYPRLFPADGTKCKSMGTLVPLHPSDVTYFDKVTRYLNVTQALQVVLAKNQGKKVTYVDTYTVTKNKDMCQSAAANRWVTPLLAKNPAHPTLASHAAMAKAVDAALAKG